MKVLVADHSKRFSAAHGDVLSGSGRSGTAEVPTLTSVSRVPIVE